MERKKVGRFTFGAKEEIKTTDDAVRRFVELTEQQLIDNLNDKLTGKLSSESVHHDAVVINEDGTIDEVATVVMKVTDPERIVDWTAIANVPEVFEHADDLTYALEAAKDINVEDAYPKAEGDIGRGLKEALIWGDREINGMDITPHQSHQLRGMTTDFDGDQLIGSHRVHQCRRIRKPSKHKKGPRKGRAFLYSQVMRHVIDFGMYGTSIHYINHFRKVKG